MINVNIRVGEAACDFRALSELASAVYGEHEDLCDVAYYSWLYSRNPHGPAITASAFVDNRLVAHYATIPMLLRIDGKNVNSGLGVNALTLPEAEGRGLFLRLVATVNKALPEQGITTSYVVPGPESEPWFRKVLHYAKVGELGLFVRPQRVCSMVRMLGLVGVLGIPIAYFANPSLGLLRRVDALLQRKWHITLSAPGGFSEEFEDLWGRVENKVNRTNVRDVRFLTWRYCDIPTRRYRILAAHVGSRLVAYAIYRVRTTPHVTGLRFGSIVDLVAELSEGGECGLAAIFDQIISECSKQGVDAVTLQLSLGSPHQSIARQCGFWRASLFKKSYRPILFLDGKSRLGYANHFTGGDYDMG